MLNELNVCDSMDLKIKIKYINRYGEHGYLLIIDTPCTKKLKYSIFDHILLTQFSGKK